MPRSGLLRTVIAPATPGVRPAALGGSSGAPARLTIARPCGGVFDMKLTHVVLIFLVVLVLVPLTMAGVVYGLFLVWGKDLPSPEMPQELAPSRKTVLLDKDGAVLEEFFIENRSPLPLQQIPEIMREAVLATEDHRFFRHWGLDGIGVVRAVLSNVAAGSIRQGASTITQQLARNIFLTHSQTFERKIKEAILAVRLERSFSKEEILELYLNQVYFGDGAYGVEAAAQRFLGKSCRELTLTEAALLAGLPQNPLAYSPRRNPDASRRRRNHVLRRLEAAGIIDIETRLEAEATEVPQAAAGMAESSAPYFAEMIRRDLMERYGGSELYRGGLTIHSTLDSRLQKAAEEAMEQQLSRIEEMQAIVYRRTPGISVRGDEPVADGAMRTPYLQGALIALEPRTGAIRALVGGRDFLESHWNRAVQAELQPGSSFKPVLFTQALLDGFRTNDILADTMTTYELQHGDTYEPRNFDELFRGPVTLRYALMRSINVPSVALMDSLGAGKVVSLARRMGIRGYLPPYLSLALGACEISALDLASAYAVFVNHGIRVEPYSVEMVEDRQGVVMERHIPQSREVIDERVAYLMVSMLRSALDRGTGSFARSRDGFHAPAGGKTGTTDKHTNAWFVGFTPDLVCAVWVGFDEVRPIGNRMTGAVAALPAWSAFMKEASAVYGSRDFEIPPGIVEVRTCEATGLRAGPDCPRTVRDAFVAGTEPTGQCLHNHVTPDPRRHHPLSDPEQMEEAPPGDSLPAH